MALMHWSDPLPIPYYRFLQAQVQAYSDNYFNIFAQKGKWNSEVIWGIQYPLTGGNVITTNRWNGPCGYHNWGNNNPTEPAVRSFEMADGTPFVWDNGKGQTFFVLQQQPSLPLILTRARITAVNHASMQLFSITELHGRHVLRMLPRLIPYNKVQSGYFYNNDGTLKIVGVDTRQSLIEGWNGTKTGYYLKKLMDPTTAGQYFNNTNTLGRIPLW